MIVFIEFVHSLMMAHGRLQLLTEYPVNCVGCGMRKYIVAFISGPSVFIRYWRSLSVSKLWRICLRLMKLTRDWSFGGRSSIQGKKNATCNSLCFLRLVWLSYILSDLHRLQRNWHLHWVNCFSRSYYGSAVGLDSIFGKSPSPFRSCIWEFEWLPYKVTMWLEIGPR